MSLQKQNSQDFKDNLKLFWTANKDLNQSQELRKPGDLITDVVTDTFEGEDTIPQNMRAAIEKLIDAKMQIQFQAKFKEYMDNFISGFEVHQQKIVTALKAEESIKRIMTPSPNKKVHKRGISATSKTKNGTIYDQFSNFAQKVQRDIKNSNSNAKINSLTSVKKKPGTLMTGANTQRSTTSINMRAQSNTSRSINKTQFSSNQKSNKSRPMSTMRRPSSLGGVGVPIMTVQSAKKEVIDEIYNHKNPIELCNKNRVEKGGSLLAVVKNPKRGAPFFFDFKLVGAGAPISKKKKGTKGKVSSSFKTAVLNTKR